MERWRQGEPFPPCKMQGGSCCRNRQWRPFSLISRGAWLCLGPSPTLTDETQPTCYTLHFPVQLFCLVGFFPFDSKSSRGDEFENFSGAWCVCVCGVMFTHGGSLPPSIVDDVPSHPFSVHPPLPTHPQVPSISWSCMISPGRVFVFSG